MEVYRNIRKVNVALQVVRFFNTFSLQDGSLLHYKKSNAALHVLVLMKYMKNLSNYFLKISQPLLQKSVNINEMN